MKSLYAADIRENQPIDDLFFCIPDAVIRNIVLYTP